MAITMRVSLPDYDALTDGTPSHYSIFADTDNVLIKELSKGTISVGAYATGTIAHNLGYTPDFYCYGVDFSDPTKIRLLSGLPFTDLNWQVSADTANIYITSRDGTTRTAYYHILYDNI